VQLRLVGLEAVAKGVPADRSRIEQVFRRLEVRWGQHTVQKSPTGTSVQKSRSTQVVQQELAHAHGHDDGRPADSAPRGGASPVGSAAPECAAPDAAGGADSAPSAAGPDSCGSQPVASAPPPATDAETPPANADPAKPKAKSG
jgi:hypothetical protein